MSVCLRSSVVCAALALSWSGSALAAPKPPTPNFAKAIDGFASYDSQSTCDPTEKPGTKAFRSLILKAYPATGDYGIVRGCSVGGTSEHKEGRAWDWKANYFNNTHKDIVNTVRDWMLAKDEHGNACAMARRLGVMYFIWNKRIWGGYRSPNSNCATAGWKDYTGSSPHQDHMHLSFSWKGAKKQTTFWTAALPANAKPKGSLSGANCNRVFGWAQDPDAPKKGIDVQVSFGGKVGEAKATTISATANLTTNQTLCDKLGSCNHGFEVASPLSLHDGKAHDVYAYAIDSAGGANAVMTNAPRSMQCEATIPKGQRRKIADMQSFDDWGFSEFWDVMPVAETALSQVDAGSAWPKAPLLVQGSDGSSELWLIDDERRRLVSADARTTWGFKKADIVEWAPADISALPQGPDLRARPHLIKGEGKAIYIMDELPETEPGRPDDPTGVAGSSGTAGAAGSGSRGVGTSNDTGAVAPGAGAGEEPAQGSCACRATPAGQGPKSEAWWLLILALPWLRRRSR